MTKKQILDLRLRFPVDDGKFMIDCFEFSESSAYFSLRNIFKDEEGFKSPYDYFDLVAGRPPRDAKEILIKRFNEWYKTLEIK